MEISEAINNCKGNPFEIPDCSRDDLPQFFLDMGYRQGAEIGVYKGYFTRKFAKAGLKMYGVDLWKPYKDFDRETDNRVARQEELYERATNLLSRYPNVTLIRKKSMDAVKDFEDESLDFVYIDANHRLKFALEDIYEWSKKVRKGGCVSGHDYVDASDFGENINSKYKRWYDRNIHVKYAVDAYVKAREYEIKNWYVLGRKDKIEGERRDKCRSFMWIK